MKFNGIEIVVDKAIPRGHWYLINTKYKKYEGETMKMYQVRLGIYGKWTGIVLASTVIFWDLLWIGARNLFHWSIGGKGICLLIIAILLIIFGSKYEER